MPVRKKAVGTVFAQTTSQQIDVYLKTKNNPGIIYCMDTHNDGLVKIGKCIYKQFNERMRYLESNGYLQTTGLKRKFAILVEDYDEKESMLHDVFSSQRVGKTELFAVTSDKVMSLMSALSGIIVYPTNISQSVIFNQTNSANLSKKIPNEKYYLKAKQRNDKKVYNATIEVKNGSIKLLKGSEIIINPTSIVQKISPSYDKKRKAAIASVDSKGRITKDIDCSSPSEASIIIRGIAYNGWTDWKTASGSYIDVFRK